MRNGCGTNRHGAPNHLVDRERFLWLVVQDAGEIPFVKFGDETADRGLAEAYEVNDVWLEGEGPQHGDLAPEELALHKLLVSGYDLLDRHLAGVVPAGQVRVDELSPKELAGSPRRDLLAHHQLLLVVDQEKTWQRNI